MSNRFVLMRFIMLIPTVVQINPDTNVLGAVPVREIVFAAQRLEGLVHGNAESLTRYLRG